MDSNETILRDVRCSFPQLYRVKKDGDSTYGMGITILLDKDKHKADIKKLKEMRNQIIKDSPKLREACKKRGLKALKGVCLRDEGEESWRDEYPENHMMLRCGAKSAPTVLHKNMKVATEEDDPIYSGCRVNVKVQLWPQANQHGKRVNARIITVQFAGDDKPFDASYVSEEKAIEGFEELPDDTAFDNENSPDDNDNESDEDLSFLKD